MITKTIQDGFHLGVGGSATGIGDYYYKKLALRRIQFVIMAADNFPAEAQEIARSQPDVRHFVGYRRSTPKASAAHPTQQKAPTLSTPGLLLSIARNLV